MTTPLTQVHSISATTRPTIVPAFSSSSVRLTSDRGRFSIGIGLSLPARASVDDLLQLGDRADVGAADGQRALHHRDQRQRDLAAVEADQDQAPALAQRRHREARRAGVVDQVDRAVQRAARDLLQLLGDLRIVPVERGSGALLPCGSKLRRVDVDRDDPLVSERRSMPIAINPSPPAPSTAHPFLARDRCERRHRRVGREPGARERGGPGRIDAARVHQVARMRNQQMVGVAARTLDADPARRHAMVVLAFAAARAGAAADPRDTPAGPGRWATSRASGPAAITVP